MHRGGLNIFGFPRVFPGCCRFSRGHRIRNDRLADRTADFFKMKSMDCLFCKIVNEEIPVRKVYEDESSIAFADINPQAPVHLLVIPRKHIQSLAEVGAEDRELLGHLLATAAKVAAQENLAQGFRVVLNIGKEGGQTVDHLHLHVLGGRAMHWPPG
jgi:histidine triad (HIT) family protein